MFFANSFLNIQNHLLLISDELSLFNNTFISCLKVFKKIPFYRFHLYCFVLTCTPVYSAVWRAFQKLPIKIFQVLKLLLSLVEYDVEVVGEEIGRKGVGEGLAKLLVGCLEESVSTSAAILNKGLWEGGFAKLTE